MLPATWIVLWVEGGAVLTAAMFMVYCLTKLLSAQKEIYENTMSAFSLMLLEGARRLPVCGLEASLQSCNVVGGPLLDVFGHLHCPLNDQGVGWSQHDGVVVDQLI